MQIGRAVKQTKMFIYVGHVEEDGDLLLISPGVLIRSERIHCQLGCQ